MPFSAVPFFLNRVLRIYPVYWLIASGTLLMVALYPTACAWKGEWCRESTALDWSGNLLTLPFEWYAADFRLVPPAWSVAVELICYASSGERWPEHGG
ncbi:MAG: hypothetical protein AAGA68_18780 [Pseudomonadota bacterium]